MKNKISQRISLISALLALLATALCSWLVMGQLYQRMPQYQEFVAGYTTWTAYYKSGDMTLAYLVLGGVVVFYVVFSFIFRMLSGSFPWLRKDLDSKDKTVPRTNEKFHALEEGCFIILFLLFSASAIGRCLDLLIAGRLPFLEEHFSFVMGALYLLAVFFLYCLSRGEKGSRKKALEWSQAFLPLVFFGIADYEYIWKGEAITQYASVKMKGAAFLAGGLLLAYNFWRILKKDREKEEADIYLSSFLSLAVFASYTLPRGTISGTPLEMYHYGELSGPLHQFLSFGTRPYLDTMPIHGVCDYFQAGVWYALFDGTYASFEAAMVMGCVAIAIITAAVYYYFTENKLVSLFCILLFSLFGDKYYYVRWAFALPFTLIIFSKKVREDFPKLLWSWTFISILSIAWNPSIGGACALAALPMVLYEGIHEKGWKIFLRLGEKEVRKKILPLYLPLLVLGIAFIPMFFAILRYIVENSVSILETTGDILMEELTSPFAWYATFGFVFSILAALYFLVGKSGKEKKLAWYALIFLVIFNGIIVRYTFVRTQYGERGIIATTISSLFLILMILLPWLKTHRSVSTALVTALLFACTVWSKGANLLKIPGSIFAREEIPAEYVYATVEETKIPGLGNIFITEAQKEELMDLNYVANELCQDLQFVDMTNQLSHYNILDKKVLLPFSSTYNTNNKIMQTKAIEVLKELKPEVIVVSPAWLHDAGSLSIRNYYMYQYLAAHYVPCKYGKVLFLTNDAQVAAEYEAAYEEMGALAHIEHLKMLPAAWGNGYLKERETKELNPEFRLVDTNAEKLGNETYRMGAKETYFLYGFEENQKGMELPFVRISVKNLENTAEDLEFEGVIYFMDEGKGLKESHRFIYNGGEGDFLIPLTSSPYWSYSENLKAFMLDFIHKDLPGKELSIQVSFEGRLLEEE